MIQDTPLSPSKLLDEIDQPNPPKRELMEKVKNNGPRNANADPDIRCIVGTPYVHSPHSAGDNYRLAYLINAIDAWGRARQLDREHGCTARSQLKKLREEVNEIEEALDSGNEIELIDGIGDTLVVLIQIMRLTEIPMIEALERAYSQIRYRKGKMIDGVFVKEGDVA